MTDTNFDTGHTVAEKLQAEVLEENPQTYFVKYGENDADIEPKTWLNETIFDADEDTKDVLYDFLVYGDPLTYTWTEERSGVSGKLSAFLSDKEKQETHQIELRSHDGGTYFEVDQDGNSTPVPSKMNGDVIELVSTFAEDDETFGNKIRSLREKIEYEYADRNVIEAFLDRYPDDRVRPSRQGWIIDDTFVVQYNAENYLLDDPGTYEREGRDVERVDESHEYVDLSFDIDAPVTETAPDDTEYELGENELEFLAMVDTMLFPDRYLGWDQAGRIIEERDAQDDSDHDDVVSETASTANENAFKESTGQVHNHSREKHSLTYSFSVTDEVLDRLHFQQNGHAGVNELARRESEFRRADFEVFHDTSNNDDRRWQSIKRKANGAPIADKTRRQMDRMFGGV